MVWKAQSASAVRVRQHHRRFRATTVLPCTAILFDCDGVLVNSDTVVLRSWTRWAHELNLNLNPEDVLATIHGRRAACQPRALRCPQQREAALKLINAFEMEDAAAVTAIPGAAELLASIPLGRWAVVTSGSRELVHARLAAADLAIPDALVTAGDVSQAPGIPSEARVGNRDRLLVSLFYFSAYRVTRQTSGPMWPDRK